VNNRADGPAVVALDDRRHTLHACWSLRSDRRPDCLDRPGGKGVRGEFVRTPGTSPREEAREIAGTTSAKKPSRRPPGRPTKLTSANAARLVAELAAGGSVTATADALGVSRRTVQLWRRRACSSRPEGRPLSSLSRWLQCALLAAAELGRPPSRSARREESLSDLLAEF
jgi:hypothetical protein